MKCPRCKKTMENGYSSANTGLSWIDEGEFNSFAFIDKDLSSAGIRKYLPWKGEYFKVPNCRQCRIVIVDYSRKFDRKTIESKTAE